MGRHQGGRGEGNEKHEKNEKEKLKKNEKSKRMKKLRADTTVTVKRPHRTRPTATTCTTTQTARERAGALTFSSSCLDGSVTRVGPGRYPQCTRADFGPEAVGSSLALQHTTMSTRKRNTITTSVMRSLTERESSKCRPASQDGVLAQYAEDW